MTIEFLLNNVFEESLYFRSTDTRRLIRLSTAHQHICHEFLNFVRKPPQSQTLQETVWGGGERGKS